MQESHKTYGRMKPMVWTFGLKHLALTTSRQMNSYDHTTARYTAL